MAEYMCSINPLLQETLPEMTPLGAPAAFLDEMGAGMQDVTEYPWMKEKKPQKKAQPGEGRRGKVGGSCFNGVIGCCSLVNAIWFDIQSVWNEGGMR